MNIEFSNRLNVAETFVEIGVFEHTRGNDKGAAAAFENAQNYLDMVRVRRETSGNEPNPGIHAEAC